jgi:hypothetical protein
MTTPCRAELVDHLVRGCLPAPSMLACRENVKDRYSCACSGTTDRKATSTVFLRMTVHCGPCCGTIARALPLVIGSAEVWVSGRRNMLAQAAACSVKKGRVGWSSVHHLRRIMCGRVAGLSAISCRIRPRNCSSRRCCPFSRHPSAWTGRQPGHRRRAHGTVRSPITQQVYEHPQAVAHATAEVAP